MIAVLIAVENMIVVGVGWKYELLIELCLIGSARIASAMLGASGIPIRVPFMKINLPFFWTI